MTSKVYTKYVKDSIGDDYELHLCKHSNATYDIYASVKNSGNKYHVFGGYVSDLNAWLPDGIQWWVTITDYVEENDIFTDILARECALEGLAEIDFLRRADDNYFSDLMLAYQKIQRGDYSPALKKTLGIIIEYLF